MKNMKCIKSLIPIAALVFITMACQHETEKTETSAAAKPYPLDTCLVCGMKLGEMSKPYVFVYQGQEIKVCDKSEKADFDKDPAKYIKKLADAEANAKK